MTIEERLSELERAARLWRLAAVAGCLVSVAAVALAVTGARPDTLRVKCLVLEGAHGDVVTLSVNDYEQKEAVELVIAGGGEADP